MILLVISILISLVIFFVLFCAVRGSDERRYLDEYVGKMEIYTFYNCDKHKVEVDLNEYKTKGCIKLFVWTRQEDLGIVNPRTVSFGSVWVNRETGEVYDYSEDGAIERVTEEINENDWYWNGF